MSTFRRHIQVTLDGEPYEVTTAASDQLKAEEALQRDKRDVTLSPVAVQARVAFYAFTRCYPEHPVARNWVKFLEVFDDIDDLEVEEGSPLDPTQSADWDD